MVEKRGLTYKDSGVDIEASEQMIERAKPMIEKTFGFLPGKLVSAVGGYAAIVELEAGPVLLPATDGVGTKIKLAELMGIRGTVGIDLVAMCVNDILVYGVTSGFFLDYYAMGKQDAARSDAILAGIIEGCMQARYALLGGETAEMPAVYGERGWDLAGFAVGVATSMDALILGNNTRPGMKVYGLASSGLHSNGFSMVWKAFKITFDSTRKRDRDAVMRLLHDTHSALGCPLYEELLRPTKIYVQQIIELRRKYEIAGMANITGGGLIDNPPRILPPGFAIEIRLGSWPVPQIFRIIQRLGNVDGWEMLRTFNNGIGFIVISRDQINEPDVYEIGQVVYSGDERYYGNRTVNLIWPHDPTDPQKRKWNSYAWASHFQR